MYIQDSLLVGKASNRILPFITQRKIDLSTSASSSPEPSQRGRTHPKPEHHLHKAIRKDHPVLQLVQTRRRLRRPVATPNGTIQAPRVRLTLINEEGHRKEKTEPQGREQRPDLRVERGQPRQEGVCPHRAPDRDGRRRPRGFGHGDDLVELRDFSHEDEVDERVGDEEDSAEGEGGLGTGEAGGCVLGVQMEC